MKHTINRIKRLHLFSYYPRPCSGVALIRRILPHTVILHMQLDILRELDTNSFECTDSDIQEGNPPLVTLPPYRRPPPPTLLAINNCSLQFYTFRSSDSRRNSREVPKSRYFDSWVVSLKKLLAYKRRVRIIRKLPKISYA